MRIGNNLFRDGTRSLGGSMIQLSALKKLKPCLIWTTALLLSLTLSSLPYVSHAGGFFGNSSQRGLINKNKVYKDANENSQVKKKKFWLFSKKNSTQDAER